MIKRFLYLLISATVLLYDQVCSSFGRLISRARPTVCVVINYHDVSDGFAERFLKQMEMLVNIVEPVSAVKDQELVPGRAYAALTFDDAFCSFVKNAWPTLRRLRIPVTLFVPTGYLGRKSAWVDYGGDNPVGGEVMSASTLKEIAADELVDVGSHTSTHADLVNLTDEAVKHELHSSREILESVLGCKIESISFPYGSFGERELRLCSEAGYKYQFSVLPRRRRSMSREGLVGRVSVQPTDWSLEFRLKVLGAYRWITLASTFKKRLLASFRGL